MGVNTIIRKFNSSGEENEDGGHDIWFEHICKTIGVDDRLRTVYCQTTRTDYQIHKMVSNKLRIVSYIM